jgi:hypothetical protein
MKRMAPVLALLVGAVWQSSALAQLQEAAVHTKGAKAPLRGFIKQESPRGLQFVPNAKKEPAIPADDITDVEYEISSTSVKIEKYRPAINKEAEANKAKEGKRAAVLAEAAKLYQETINALGDKDIAAKRHLEYKVAALAARIAEEDGKEASRQAAVTKLNNFRKRHPQSWQQGPCLKTLAQLQMSLELFADAEETFKALAEAPVPDSLKQYAQLETLQVSIVAGRAARAKGNEAEAIKRFNAAVDQLKTLAAASGNNKAQQQRAHLALAEMLTELGKYQDAQQYANLVLKDTTDKNLRATAYNALGFAYYRNKQLQEARWQFLWVDVIYNQDKAEHAKALYYLADIFNALGEGERGRECLDQLLNDPEFAGEYQRRAQRDEEARQKKEKS